MIYAIQCGDSGPVKFGFAKNPIKRLREMQVGHHEVLHLRGVEEVEDDVKAEAELHRRLSIHRMRGEWFRPSPEVMEVCGHMEKGMTMAMFVAKDFSARIKKEKELRVLSQFITLFKQLEAIRAKPIHQG